MLRHSIITKYILLAILCVLGLFTGVLIWNYVHAVFFGVILGGILQPVQSHIEKHFHLPSLGGTLLISFTFVSLLLAPVVAILYNLSMEISIISQQWGILIHNGKFLSASQFIAQINSWLEHYNITLDPATLETTLRGWLDTVTNYLFGQLSSLAQNTFHFVFQSLMMLLVLIGVLVNGATIKRFLFRLIPPEQRPDVQNLIARFHQVNFATLVVNAIGAVVQGTLCGLFLFFLGFGTAVFFGCLVAISSFLPGLGTLAVVLPVGLYLYKQAPLWQSISFLVFGGLLYILIENFIKPHYLSRNLQISSLLLFLSIVMGVTEFGILGLFYGPLIISLFVTAADAWHQKSLVSSQQIESRELPGASNE